MRFRPPPVGRGDAPESECRLTRGGPPPPNRGHLQEAGLEQPGRQGDLEARSRVPATLVDTIFGAIADAGSIPAVSTGIGFRTDETADLQGRSLRNLSLSGRSVHRSLLCRARRSHGVGDRMACDRHGADPIRAATSGVWVQLWSVGRAGSAAVVVAAQLPSRFSACSEREPGSAA
jgi:hypothetical protein